MVVKIRHATLLALVGLVGIMATSCAESKVAQCNKMTAVINKAVTDIKALGKKNQNADQKTRLVALSEMSTKMDGYAKELQALDLKDEKLKGFQGSFIKMYQDSGKASREIVTAVEKKDSKAANTALKNLQSATAPESQLVDDSNKYCQGK